MIKKKLLCPFLILTFASCLVACGDNEENETNENTTIAAETTTEEVTTLENVTTTEKETTAKTETTIPVETTQPQTTEKMTEKETTTKAQETTTAKKVIKFTTVEEVVYAAGYTKAYADYSTTAKVVGELGKGNAVKKLVRVMVGLGFTLMTLLLMYLVNI